MASGTRRKRGLDAQSQTSSSKRCKNVKWEWLGDGGKWTEYSDDNNNDITKAFIAGKEETVFSVAPGVKMKARFTAMTQSNMSTGWQRDIRCVGSDSVSMWEWDNELDDGWIKFPDIASRILEASYLCGLDEACVSVAMKPYKVNLLDNEMVDTKMKRKWNIRRTIQLESDHKWEWQDEHGNWNVYPSNHVVRFESALSNKDNSIELIISGRSYIIDLSNMEQENKTTNVKRKIRRTPLIKKEVESTVKEAEETGNEEAGPTLTRKRSKQEVGTSKLPKVKKTDTIHSKSGPSHTNTIADHVKSRVFTGKCPVDGECSRLGKAHVFCEGSDVWNCTLNQTNIKNNNNKFYIIQLLEDNNNKSYSVWFRWGRVGKTGQSQLQSYGSNITSAKDTFVKKFYDKTHNDWDDRNNFQKIAGKYDLVEVDYEAKDETDAPCDEEMDGIEEKVESKLDTRLQSLINLICNVQAMEDAVKEMKYDTKKAPLGKLTSSQIKHGYVALKKIEDIIALMDGSNSNTNSLSNKLIKACDEFYTRVPHDFGMRTPQLIKTKEIVKQKLTLLETLGDIQIALKVIQGGDKTLLENPIDRHYKELQCKLQPLEDNDEMVSLIEKYIKQTHGRTHTEYTLSVTDVFEVDKENDRENFKDVGNRQLLWHGSRISNWVGIINKGLRIAPPEAPVTGYMFGKGVYFADIASKSANYCFATPTKNEGLCLLCEVSLGSPNELLAADYKADKLPNGTHSVKGMGRMEPDPAHNHTLADGCIIPLGHTHDTGVRNSAGYTLNYNEFVVYETCQIKMRYLVRLKFNYK